MGSGLTRVFDIDQSTGRQTQVGQDIWGRGSSDLTPDHSMAVISSDYRWMAVCSLGSGWAGFVRPGTGGEGWFDPSEGEVTMWELNEADASDPVSLPHWVEMGEPIRGEIIDGERFGFPVSISNRGEVVAVGSYSPDSGIRVHVNEETSPRVWTLKGSVITGEAPLRNERIETLPPGWWVSLSDDGNTVALGTFLKNSANLSGLVNVLQFDPSIGDWLPRGDPIKGKSASDFFGLSVDLSNDGKTIVVEELGVLGVGLISVFEFNEVSSQWNQLGSDLSGYLLDSMFQCRITANGHRVFAVFAIDNGYACVFDYDEQLYDWRVVGGIIEGPKQILTLALVSACPLQMDQCWQLGGQLGGMKMILEA